VIFAYVYFVKYLFLGDVCCAGCVSDVYCVGVECLCDICLCVFCQIFVLGRCVLRWLCERCVLCWRVSVCVNI